MRRMYGIEKPKIKNRSEENRGLRRIMKAFLQERIQKGYHSSNL